MNEAYSIKNDVIITPSIDSGSEADASQRLFNINIFGFDNLADTLKKNFFSCENNNQSNIYLY